MLSTKIFKYQVENFLVKFLKSKRLRTPRKTDALFEKNTKSY